MNAMDDLGPGAGFDLPGAAAEPPPPRARSAEPLLAALLGAGTAHIYGDTADAAELDEAIGRPDGSCLAGVDGNTANQPLVRKALAGCVSADDARAWSAALAPRAHDTDFALAPMLYAAACARIGNAFRARFAGAHWDTSLQLHMELGADLGEAKAVARALARAVPGALIKVPFAPHLPQSLLLARDLEAEGIRVNLTSTFSARQVVAAALLANVSRTNVFMGRLNQGLGAALLGEHVCLEAQRVLLALRRSGHTATQLIVASLRDWRTLVAVAGCDAFTAPCAVLRSFLAQRDVAPEAVRSQLETSYADRLGVGAAASGALGAERIARLYRVEPEFIEFLLALRGESAGLDGPALARCFERAGFGDFFHAPTSAQWLDLRRDKLVPLDDPLAPMLALDTHYTLRAHADFELHQQAIDQQLRQLAGA